VIIARTRRGRSPIRSAEDLKRSTGAETSILTNGVRQAAALAAHNPEKRERFATALEHCDMVAATLTGVPTRQVSAASRHGTSGCGILNGAPAFAVVSVESRSLFDGIRASSRRYLTRTRCQLSEKWRRRWLKPGYRFGWTLTHIGRIGGLPRGCVNVSALNLHHSMRRRRSWCRASRRCSGSVHPAIRD